jgi:hypothetical protein
VDGSKGDEDQRKQYDIRARKGCLALYEKEGRRTLATDRGDVVRQLVGTCQADSNTVVVTCTRKGQDISIVVGKGMQCGSACHVTELVFLGCPRELSWPLFV